MTSIPAPSSPPSAPSAGNRAEILTREQMLALGAYGFLTHGVEQSIPIGKVERMLTVPACPKWGSYSGVNGRKAVEVKFSVETDAYLLFAGADLVELALQRGDDEILAFVEPDHGRTR